MTWQIIRDTSRKSSRHKTARSASNANATSTTATAQWDFHADVWLVEDRNASGIWRVEYQDDNGGCYVTIFAGPVAERRARTYYEALQAKRLPTIREGAQSH